MELVEQEKYLMDLMVQMEIIHHLYLDVQLTHQKEVEEDQLLIYTQVEMGVQVEVHLEVHMVRNQLGREIHPL